MTSEREMIGQRMSERLCASGWLSSVEVELQEKSFMLTFSPKPAYTISQRVMQFCVNFFGEIKPPARAHDLFGWCAAFVEFPHERTCKVWVACDFYCGYAGFDVLTELLLLGLKLSSTLPSSSEGSAYRLENLVRLFRTKDEVLTFYAQFVAQIIQDGDDLPTDACAPRLRVRWTCCPKHRYIFLQRLLVADWLHHILYAWEFDEEYEALPDTDYLETHPSEEEMQQRLSRLLAQTFSPQEWLRAYFAYAVQVEQGHWYRPIKHVCQRKHHVSNARCQFHTATTAIWYLFSAWLEHYNDLYQISSYVDERGHACRLSSINGIALLIHLAGLNVDGISFSKWFEHLSSVDIHKFHLQL